MKWAKEPMAANHIFLAYLQDVLIQAQSVLPEC